MNDVLVLLNLLNEKDGAVFFQWSTQLMNRLIFRFQKLVSFWSQWIESFEYVTTTQPANRRMVDNIPVLSIKLR